MDFERIILNAVFIGLVFALIVFARWMWYSTPRYISPWEGVKIEPLPKIKKYLHTYSLEVNIFEDFELNDSVPASEEIINQIKEELIQRYGQDLISIEITGRMVRPWLL